MQFEIKSRGSGRVVFTAKIDCEASASVGVKRGLAVKAAHASDAVLRDADLSGADLRGADLRGAVLSGAVLSGAVLRDAVLSYAVLSDADLRGADLRGADLRGAVLRYAVLRYAVLSYAVLSDADLRGADLRGADLRGADLSGAVLRDAVLSYAVLSDADLNDVPKIENIDVKILAAIKAGGKLDMGDWHTCGTTHCRGGWAVELAGEAGAELERRIGSAAAATLIYIASTPDAPVPDFYTSDEKAMQDIQERAAKQIAEA